MIAFLIILGIITPQSNNFATELFNQTNDSRVEHLKWDKCLSYQATKRAEEMVENNYFSHTDLNGKKPFKDMIESCVDYTHAGENLIKDFNNP